MDLPLGQQTHLIRLRVRRPARLGPPQMRVGLLQRLAPFRCVVGEQGDSYGDADGDSEAALGRVADEAAEVRPQSRLNLAVKFRESFRPFAPAVLAEDVGAWFDSSAESDYMNYTANLLPSRRAPLPENFADFKLKERLDFPRSEIQSVIHVDFSARLQTLHADVHPDFHALVTAFKKITGVPILINTSFNVAGQPIVRTAAEAWDCFVNTDLDLLVLNDEVYRHPGQKTREQKIAWLNQFSKLA